MRIKNMLLSTAALGLAVALTTDAFATPLNGTFQINVYQGSGGGNINDPRNQAVRGNPLINPGNLIASLSYTGNLNFNVPQNGTNTLQAFLDSGGGTVTGAVPNAILSTSGYGTTSVFDITGTTGGFDLAGTVTHDDGASLYQGATTIFTNGIPNTAVPNAYNLPNGSFELVYVEANGLPAVLNFDVTSRTTPAPEPASLALLGSGLLAIGLVARRRTTL